LVETTVFTYYNSVTIFTLSCQVAELSQRLSAPDDEALKEAVKEWLEGQTEDFYFSGNNSLPEKCRECIELIRDCVEK